MATISSDQLSKLIELFESSLKQMNSMTERFMGMAVAPAAAKSQKTTKAKATADKDDGDPPPLEDETEEESNLTLGANYTVSPVFGETRRSKIKPRRPTIDIKTDETKWEVFKNAWKRYKKQLNLVDDVDRQEICMELRNACSDEVDSLLYHFAGSDSLEAESLTEKELLEFIHEVAVDKVSVHVHRMEFSKMKQDTNEPIVQFVGRLKAAATFCSFKKACGCGHKECAVEVNYADEMISQQLVNGLSSHEHQLRLLAESDELKTLDARVKRLIGMEKTDDTQLRIRNPSQANAGISSYNKNKRKSAMNRSKQRRNDRDDTPERKISFQKSSEKSSFQKRGDNNRRESHPKSFFKHRLCRGCGKRNHGHGKELNRRDCPAFGKRCRSCGMMNHFSMVCEQRSTNAYFMFGDADDTGDETSYYPTEDECESCAYTSDEEDAGDTSQSLAARCYGKKLDFRENHAPERRW